MIEEALSGENPTSQNTVPKTSLAAFLLIRSQALNDAAHSVAVERPPSLRVVFARAEFIFAALGGAGLAGPESTLLCSS